MLENANKVLTIGHSTLPIGAFLAMFEKAGVTAIADARSSPFSRRMPHFSRNELRASLKECGIKYVFLGKELGGRPRTSALYCDGIADYEKMALVSARKHWESFQSLADTTMGAAIEIAWLYSSRVPSSRLFSCGS